MYTLFLKLNKSNSTYIFPFLTTSIYISFKDLPVFCCLPRLCCKLRALNFF